MAPSQPLPSDPPKPQPLTGEALVTVMATLLRIEDDNTAGIRVLRLPLPDCPDCGRRPTEIVRTPMGPQFLVTGLYLAFNACGHVFTLKEADILKAEPAARRLAEDGAARLVRPEEPLIEPDDPTSREHWVPRAEYDRACEQIAAMHAAAVGEVRGPSRGVVEDVEDVRTERDEARSWARHGYEIGQRHCGWTDPGVAPAWLTDGFPAQIDDCQHLNRASALDTTVSEIRRLLPAIARALEELPSQCRYHQDRLDSDRPSFGRDACCDTGVPARLRRDAVAALNSITLATAPGERP